MLSKTNNSTIVIVILLVGLSIGINNMVIKVRLQEANYYLHQVAQEQFSQNTFIIASKYALIKKRIESGESEVGNFTLEGQMQATLTDDKYSVDEITYEQISPYHPVSLILKSLRAVLGKKELVLPQNSRALNQDLERSFYLERNRNYERAIANYDKITLDHKLDDQVSASILLHKAFCVSMLGNLTDAAELYDGIHSKYPETDVGIISKDLRDFLYSLIEKRRAIIETDSSDLLIGRELYYSMNFNEALPFLNSEIGKQLPNTEPEARYFKGRILEEVGQFRQATVEYHKIMYLDRENEWCKSANRRLIMLGTVYKQEHPLIESAETNLASMDDTTFLTSVQEIKEILITIPEEDSLEVELLEESLSLDDTLLTTLEIKDSIEVIPETPPVIQQPQRPSIQTQPVVSRPVRTREEIVELRRRLASSEFRSASFIRETIDNNTPSLHEIYLEYVNSGNVISGNMKVEMKISASGTIDASLLQSDITNTEFNNRVVAKVSQWKFPAIDSELGTVTISYPFSFR